MEKDPEFWFEDGNIVLIARGVEFRVYKGLLIKHSPVFRVMLSLPQPSVTEKSNGVAIPTVELSDHPVDIKTLFADFIFGDAFRYVISFPLMSSCAE